MKLLFTALGLLLLSSLHAQQLHLCFKSTDSVYMDDPFHLSFNVIDKDWANGFVQYKGQKAGLLLSFGAEKVLKTDDAGKPVQVEYSFNELTNGKTTGKYYLSIAGTQVMYFYYYDKRRKSKINFAQDFSAGEKCGCNW